MYFVWEFPCILPMYIADSNLSFIILVHAYTLDTSALSIEFPILQNVFREHVNKARKR